MFEGFRKGLRLFLGSARPTLLAEEERPPTPRELISSDGFVRVAQHDGQVHLQTSFCPEPMIVLPGSLDGPLSAVRGQVAGREAMLLSFPVMVAGRSRKVQLTVARHGERAPAESFALVRASRRRVPPADQALELVYRHDNSEIRYLVEMDLEIPPVGFRELARNRAVFEEVPPVSQMIAFLKATIHQRRTALRSLSSLARRVSDRRVQDMVTLLQETLSQSHDFSNPVLTELLVDLQRAGRPVNANTLAAMTLLADIHLGNLGRPELESLTEQGLPLATSLTAAEAAASFLGVEPEAWRALRPPRPEGVAAAAEFLEQAVGQRTALTILADLAEDSGSERSRARVERLQEKVAPGQVLTNDEHEALKAYLASLGRPVQPDTLAALGIFVDFEAGILSEDDIDALTPSRGFLDTSLYGMVAISGAFDAELRPFCLVAERQAQLWEGLMQLLRVTRGGLVARFLEPSQAGVLTLCITSPGEIVPLRSRGLTFTGEVLAQLPTLDYLAQEDLEVLARACPGLMACFESEDKKVQWRRLDSVERPSDLDLLKGRHNYIDGYRLYRFHGRVVARTQKVERDELRWRKDFVTVFRDARGNAHYLLCARLEDLAPPRQDLEWAGEVVEFPDLTGCPSVLVEPSHEFLLGRPEERGLKQQRLDRIYEGLEAHLTQPWTWYNLAQHPAHLARLRTRLRASAVKAALAGVVDLTTRNGLVQALSESHLELQVAEPLLQSLDLAEMEELAALIVLYRMCCDVELPGLRKYYNLERFRELLVDRLFAVAASEDPVVRMQAARLMGSDLVAYAPGQQLAVSYVLSRFLENEKVAVARQAARSLAALSLEELAPLPETVQARLLSPGKRKKPKKGRTVDTHELEEIRSELDHWLQSSEAALSPLTRRLAEPAMAGEVSEWVARLNDTFRHDTSLARHRFLLVQSEDELDRFLANSVRAWQEFAAERGSAVPELLQVDDLAGLKAEFRVWAENRDAFLENPWLIHLAPGQACSVRGKDRLSPLFARIAEGLEPGRSMRLIRWLAPDPGRLHDQPELFLHAGRLWADELLLFRPRQHRFVPMYDRDSPLRRQPAIEKDMRALAAVASLPGQAHAPELVAAVAGGPPSLQGLAVTVMGVFNIPSDSLRLVQTMLAGLLPRYHRMRS